METMELLRGNGVSGGVTSGPLFFLRREDEIPHNKVTDPAAELTRFQQAKSQAVEALGRLEAEAAATLGQEQALLFQIHQMMLDDPDYVDGVTQHITEEHWNAAYAVWQTGEDLALMFAAMDDAYMQARAADVRDISRRVVRLLLGRGEDALPAEGEPVILAADDLAPSETARLDRSRVRAFITAQGTGNSHTAIFARTMGIPAVVALGSQLRPDQAGRTAWVDGGTGEVYLDPAGQTLAQLQQRRAQWEENRRLAEQYRGVPATGADGRRILLCANIGSPKDLEAVSQADADGIGLFRSEFLYLGREDFPSEEEQFQAYRQVLEAMGQRPVVVRTLDIGADKQASYFDLPKEENPAMGLRAIRICLTRPEVFRTQLRALYRASAFGNLSVMFPMIASLGEIQQIKALCAQVRQELAAEGVAFREVPLGMMIETPAAAVLADQFAPEVDFFSIGTNDLTQYTLAADRQNPAIGPFCDPHHPAVLRLIRRTVEEGHRAGIWVGICGELAADETLSGFFAELGVDELSMVPGKILPVKRRLLERQVP